MKSQMRWVMAAVLAMGILGCERAPETSSPSQKEKPAGEAARTPAPTTRVRVEPTRATAASAASRATVRRRETIPPATTTSTAAGLAPSPTPQTPIAAALEELEKIPVQLVDRATTEQIAQVRAAIVNLEDKYMQAGLIRSDAQQARLQEQLEKYDALAQKLLEAGSADEFRELYRQLSEGLKLMDAELVERARQEDARAASSQR